MYLSFIHQIIITDIDKRVVDAIEGGANDEEILKLGEDRISELRRLLKAVDGEQLEKYLQEHHPGCYKYVKLLERLANKVSE